jgi:hypothetical protein
MSDGMDVSPQAVDRLAAIAGHIQNLRHHFGDESKEYLDAAGSWINCQANIFRLLGTSGGGGGGRLYAEGDLSMGLTTSYGLQVGIVFFRDRAYDGALINPEGESKVKEWWSAEYHYCLRHRAPIANEVCRGKPAESTEDDYCIPYKTMLPGTWSMHS